MPVSTIDPVTALVVIDLQKGITITNAVHPVGDVIRKTHAFSRNFAFGTFRSSLRVPLGARQAAPSKIGPLAEVALPIGPTSFPESGPKPEIIV